MARKRPVVRKPQHRGRPRPRRTISPLKLRVAKALDKIYAELGTDPERLNLNDRKVLERVRDRLTGAVLRPLSEADLINIERIARKHRIRL